jgi:beta-lactamase superfamily II metal-dependent hydrolase
VTHFGLDALQADKGDALVLRWGKDGESFTALIDGGPGSVYDDAIQPHLAALAGVDPAGQPLPVLLELVVVSHVDDDHINGIIDLANAIDTAQRQAVPLPVTVTEVWHNAFGDMEFLDDFADEPGLQDAIRNADAQPAALIRAARPREDPTIDDITAGAQSIRQGRQLDRLLRTINVPRNTSFDDRGRFVREGAPLDVRGVSVQVVAPDTILLGLLRTEWRKELKKLLERESAASRVAALAAAFDDDSVPNQSSIVLLVEFVGMSMLLTGDARGDHLIKALARNPDVATPLEVDIFKVPHHGSSYSNGPELFATVIATDYVISGNGEHGNPHPDTLRALFATEHRPITVHLTNHPLDGAVKPDDVAKATEAQEVLDEAASESEITIRYREDGDLAISVDLV